jgi:hypothetical protein
MSVRKLTTGGEWERECFRGKINYMFKVLRWWRKHKLANNRWVKCFFLLKRWVIATTIFESLHAFKVHSKKNTPGEYNNSCYIKKTKTFWYTCILAYVFTQKFRKSFCYKMPYLIRVEINSFSYEHF